MKWIDKKQSLHLGKGKFLQYGDDVDEKKLGKKFVDELKEANKVGDILAPASFSLKKDIASLKADKLKLEKEITSLKAGYLPLEKEIVSLKAKEADVEKEIEIYKSIADEVDSLKLELEETKNALARDPKKALLKDLENQVKDLEVENAVLVAENADLRGDQS